MRIVGATSAFPLALACLFGGSAVAAGTNELSRVEREAGFVVLFNGHDLDGWRSNGDWAVRDGAIAFRGDCGTLVHRAIVNPDDFELRFEWKLPTARNISASEAAPVLP